MKCDDLLIYRISESDTITISCLEPARHYPATDHKHVAVDGTTASWRYDEVGRYIANISRG